MSTNFLDLKGRIADLEEILSNYEHELFCAERENNQKNIEKFQRLIAETENKIEGMKNSPNYRG